MLAATLKRQPPGVIMMLAIIMILLIALVDYLTGTEVSISIFYLIPIMLVAWYTVWWLAVIISGFTVVIWFLADMLEGSSYSHPLIPYWNAFVLLGIFLTSAWLLAALRDSLNQRELMIRFLIHDLRAPLTNVLLGLQTLERNAGDSLNATAKNLIEIACSGGERALDLVNGILDLSRLKSGQFPMELSSLRAEDLVDSAISHVSMWTKNLKVEVKKQIDPDVPSFRGDRELVTRMLVNLLSNALKFSPEHSTVTLRVKAWESTSVVFSVIDQGPGIPLEWRKKVFDLFAQVDARQSGVAVGTGVGLAFCHVAVNAQGGHIWIESEEGSGTTVTFTLPG